MTASAFGNLPAYVVASLPASLMGTLSAAQLDGFTANQVIAPAERVIPRLAKVRYDTLHQHLRAHLPDEENESQRGGQAECFDKGFHRISSQFVK